MFYNHKFIIKIWVNTVFGFILLGTILAKGHPLGRDYFDMPMKFGSTFYTMNFTLWTPMVGQSRRGRMEKDGIL
jgi:hypothetical protein